MTNSIGMPFCEIPPGELSMGQEGGRDCDERPVHRVTVSRFQIASRPVTNAEYELFDPSHRRFRGIRRASVGNGEAVTWVSWHDAVAFCAWLGEREGVTHRLPTEAEWEYACRAGTDTPYWTGDALPDAFLRNQPEEGDWAAEGTKADDDLRQRKGTRDVDLTVGRTPANAFGLTDVHGTVEEWCQDWYGPYADGPQRDPVGPADGMVRVTRGGSHSTYAVYLRSAERHAAFPDDRHWLIGFRVVRGERRTSQPSPPVPLSLDDASVSVERAVWDAPSDRPLFSEPQPFVIIDHRDECRSWLHHNHHPSITWCENGDLLACWFNTRSEIGREMRILASRRRRGADHWDGAREFFDVADRNTTGSTVFHDGGGRLFYFGGVSESSHHRDQCMVMATSADSGRSWTTPHIISSTEDRHKYTPLDSIFVAADGALVLAMDYAPLGFKANECGAGVFVSSDGGKTWDDRISGKQRPEIRAGGTGSLIAGFHTAIVQRADGALLAFGRTNRNTPLDPIDGRMPQSVSHDMGHTWHYSASPFPTVAGGQRLAMTRLRSGPLLFVSFTDESRTDPIGMELLSPDGTTIHGYGMFAALSYDDGETWPLRRLLTTGGPQRKMDGGGNTHTFTMDDTHAEPRGYLAITETPDEVIHLISSHYHYRFNRAWLERGR